MRICTKCKTPKPVTDFHAKKRYRDGLDTWCKDCRSSYVKDWKKKNLDKVAAVAKRHYDAHGDELRRKGREYYAENRELIQQRARDRYDPETQKYKRLKKLYGLELEEYDRLVEIAGGKCQICGVPGIETSKGLVVDHDHETGDVRGLLCTRCNVGLGQFGDDMNLLNKALNYLSVRVI